MARDMLARYLECAYKESNEGRRELNDFIRRKEVELGRPLTHYHEDKLWKTRELLQSTEIESTTLVQTEFHDTVINGAKYATCMREAVPVFRARGPTYRAVKKESVSSTTAYAAVVSEGAEIPVRTQDYGYIDIDIEKVGERPLITKELIEDGKFDVIALEVEHTGERIENKLNYDTFDSMFENAGTEHDCAGSNLGVKAVAGAMGKVKANGFMPNTIVMHPELETAVLSDYVPTNYYGAEVAQNTGQIPKLLGLRALVWGGTSSGTTYTYDYDTDGDMGGIVFDSRAAGCIAMARDLTVENYDDPVKDLRGVTCTMRYGGSYIQADAISLIEY